MFIHNAVGNRFSCKLIKSYKYKQRFIFFTILKGSTFAGRF